MWARVGDGGEDGMNVEIDSPEILRVSGSTLALVMVTSVYFFLTLEIWLRNDIQVTTRLSAWGVRFWGQKY